MEVIRTAKSVNNTHRETQRRVEVCRRSHTLAFLSTSSLAFLLNPPGKQMIRSLRLSVCVRVRVRVRVCMCACVQLSLVKLA